MQLTALRSVTGHGSGLSGQLCHLSAAPVEQMAHQEGPHDVTHSLSSLNAHGPAV